MPDLRPLVPDDADAVLDVMTAAFGDLGRRLGDDPGDGGGAPPDREPGLRRIRHLATTDPAGAWVALGEDGAVEGAALAIVREGLWGLSLLVVRPGRQSSGAGRALLGAALGTAAGTRGGIILASADTRALRAYSRAGFAMRPSMDFRGTVRHRPEPPAAVRPGRWPEVAGIADAASRAVRGASHAGEVPNLLAAGCELLVHEAGGWACWNGGELRVLAAHDEGAAADLLRAGLARVPAGARVEVDFVDAANGWAAPVLFDAGLIPRPSGAIFVRGDTGPLAPYLPSGAYL